MNLEISALCWVQGSRKPYAFAFYYDNYYCQIRIAQVMLMTAKIVPVIAIFSDKMLKTG